LGKIEHVRNYNTLIMERQHNSEYYYIISKGFLMKNRIFIATGNPGKLREIEAILSSLSLDFLSPNALGKKLNVPETGATYAENAWLKAKAYLAETSLPVLADDSGLEVNALNGAPGIYSARYGGKPHATDADRREHLLHQLEGHPQPWQAHFHCTVVLLTPDGQRFQTEGRCPGIIIPEARGQGGFGYDPIFFLPEYNASMAEISADLKNQISHRARALEALKPDLRRLYRREEIQ
jgi:XTP/dITP diphosphohydrolase